MQVEKTNKAFAYKIYSHFTQQCISRPSDKIEGIHKMKKVGTFFLVFLVVLKVKQQPDSGLKYD